MEAIRPAAAPPPGGGVNRAFSKLLRRHRATDDTASLEDDVHSIQLEKLKLSANLASFFAKADAPHPLSSPAAAAYTDAAESLLASLFAAVSAVKAAYAQLQMAQAPYDPDAIQEADAAVVASLKRLSEMKHAYIKDPLGSWPATLAASKGEEQHHLLQTYQITARKLETELGVKEGEAKALRSRLADSEKAERALEARLHPGRTLAALDGLHHSGLNPTHFLVALRHAVKSIRLFAKSMLGCMHSAGWDVTAAAAVVHPGVPLRRPEHASLALESYICMKMFANFHRRGFNLGVLQEREYFDRQRFFKEFTELKDTPLRDLLDGGGSERCAGLAKFIRAKYLSVVHAKMEAAFFGRLEQRAVVSSGPGFPDSEWFRELAEMARRVWLLHCLFYAFGKKEGEEEAGSIFQARSGLRFSEVYMESATEEAAVPASGEEEGSEMLRYVGFTVVPGFRIGHTVIQCRVYLTSSGDVNRRGRRRRR